MLYQPGKGLLVLATFQMDNSTSANLNQSVGYFNTQNGVFFRRTGGVNALVLRSNTSGTPSDARFVNQTDWNGDKLDGTGPSGYTLDLTHPQILWMGVDEPEFISHCPPPASNHDKAACVFSLETGVYVLFNCKITCSKDRTSWLNCCWLYWAPASGNRTLVILLIATHLAEYPHEEYQSANYCPRYRFLCRG